jgi:hypothetical protein
MAATETRPVLMSQEVWGDPVGSLEPVESILKYDLGINQYIVPPNH